MGIELATKYLPYVDELFSTESKKSMITNNDFDWTGAHTVKIYKITTAEMNDYDRLGTGSGISRYGDVQSLDATTEEMTLKKDRSFTFAIDTLDSDETLQQLQGASALARQQREIIIPEVDKYVYGVMIANAGHKPTAIELTATNIYEEILNGTTALDNAEVPEDGNRVLLVTPETYVTMKKCKDITMDTDIGNEMRLKGVIGMVDGLAVVKVPANRLPEGFGFMIAHPCATVAPTKLESYIIHTTPPFLNGSLVEGRIVYDAFVLDNKVKAIYYQAKAAAKPGSGSTEGTESTGA